MMNSLIMCGQPLAAVELPDTGGMCCIGAAYMGPDRCTCWRPVYDKRQRKIKPDLPQTTRGEMCPDCAYKANSPENAGAPGYAGTDGELMDLVYSGQPFMCHQGMRKPIELRHPSGVTIPGHPASYSPPMKNGVAYKADGTPADLCAGWAACRAAFLSEPVEVEA